MAAFLAPILIMCAGLSIDMVVLSQIQGELQSATDVAAIAGVKEMEVAGRTSGQIEGVVKNSLQVNLGESGLLKRSGQPATTIAVSRPDHAVDVQLELAWRPFFMHFVSEGVTPVRTKARAQSMGRRLVCVLGLSGASPAGVHIKNNGNVTARDCDVYSNTNKPAGLIVDDSAKVKAALICVVGGYAGGAGASPTPLTDCPVFPDPLASRSPPVVGGCDYNDLLIKDEIKTLDPGVYCGGIKISGTSKVSLNPGTYIIADGRLEVTGSGTLEGESAGFYLTGSSATIDFDAGSTISLKAPKSGPLAGILFFEDRGAPSHRTHRIRSNDARMLLGTIYLSRGKLLIEGGAQVAGDSAYTAIIVDNLELREGPELVLNGGYGDTDVPVPEGLIAGRPVLTQ
jgi:Putative Flp pilus-assembly TadE/G-like